MMSRISLSLREREKERERKGEMKDSVSAIFGFLRDAGLLLDTVILELFEIIYGVSRNCRREFYFHFIDELSSYPQTTPLFIPVPCISKNTSGIFIFSELS